MCGIAGYIYLDRQRPVDPATLRAMAAVIHHRGPDGYGWAAPPDAGVGFSHARLSIIDLVGQRGKQPFTREMPEGNTLLMAHNGEFYDFKRYRSLAMAEGERYRTKSDSEIALTLFASATILLILVQTRAQRLKEDSGGLPEDAIRPVQISPDGRVLVREPGNEDLTEVGEIELATFINPAGLEQLGSNLFAETVASGPPVEGMPLEDNRGGIRQGLLESSNVDPTRELVELIRTQRAFEMNSQSIRTADEALATTAQLRR